MKILAVGANPDDVELLCAGTLALYAEKGHAVSMCYLTTGDKGGEGIPQSEIAAARRRETEKAADLIGADVFPLGIPDGEVEVINRCVNEKDGRLREAKGRAWSVDPDGNARLKVSFFWPFRGDYWIIDLGKEYEYAVVGSPNRKYLWILARQPAMDDSVYKGILERLTSQGFSVEQLVR